MGRAGRSREARSLMSEFGLLTEEECRDLLEASRRLEKEQALLYRGLAARAEASGEVDLAQRFHDLHADEQHHLSRLTARVLELKGRPAELKDVIPPTMPLGLWD